MTVTGYRKCSTTTQPIAVVELVGPPAAGKSRLAHDLSELGHIVVEEQLQANLRSLGTAPRTPQEQLLRQKRIIGHILEAARSTPDASVIDVGVVAALIFGVARLPRDLSDRLVDWTVTTCDEVGYRLAGVCLLDAPEPELRRRAEADRRRRSHLDRNLELTPTVTSLVSQLAQVVPNGVLHIDTQFPIPVKEVSAWIDWRVRSLADCIPALRSVVHGEP